MSGSFSSSQWPDPNSPVLSKIDFGVPVVDLLLWLDVRDALLGENERKQDVSAALALARGCKHPDALWLTSVCKDVTTKEEARAVFLSFETDARALCFAWFLSQSRSENLLLLRRASDLGCACAASALCFESKDPPESFCMARLAAKERERDGFFWLGFCFLEGRGCVSDVEKAKQNFLISGSLGHVAGSMFYGRLLNETDLHRWSWLARPGWSTWFQEAFLEVVHRVFDDGSGKSSTVVFAIGCALKGKIDMEKKEILGNILMYDSLIGPANQAVSFYDEQTECARIAVNTWAIVGKRFGIAKDIRRLIGTLIWDARFEASYSCGKSERVFGE